MSIVVQIFTHMIAFLGAASFSDAFGVKAIIGGFCVKQDGVMLASIAFCRAPAGSVMPDNFIFEAGTPGIWFAAKDLVQNHSCVMDDPPIEMHIQAAIVRQQSIQQCECFV